VKDYKVISSLRTIFLKFIISKKSDFNVKNHSKHTLKEMDLSFVLLEIKGQLPFFMKEIIKDVSNSIKYEMNHLCAGGSYPIS